MCRCYQVYSVTELPNGVVATQVVASLGTKAATLAFAKAQPGRVDCFSFDAHAPPELMVDLKREACFVNGRKLKDNP